MALVDIIKKVFGTKSERDMKQVKPILEKVLAAYESIDKLSNDELRAKAEDLKRRIREVEEPFEKRIAEIKEQLESDIPVSQKESLATESDKLVKDEDAEIEKILNEILPDAFAIMKSTARRFAQNPIVEVTANDFDRNLSASHDFVKIEGDKALWQNHWMAGGNEVTWDMVHYDVQIIGGIVLHQGKIAEMATGEGKTLVATLPVFLNALAGKGVHMVTVNDYLSKRDSEWMGPLYMFHGLSVDCIDKHEPNSDARRRAYECDVTFGTNNEFGFDYLRDNMDAVHVKSTANAISAGSHIISSSPKLTPSHTRVSSDFRGSRNRTHVHPAARNTSRYNTPRNAVMKELPSNEMVHQNKKSAQKPSMEMSRNRRSPEGDRRLRLFSLPSGPPVRDSQQFSSRFQRQITIPPTVNSIRPEAPSKGISRKGRNTSDDSGGAVHHRTSKDTCTGILPQTNLSVCRIYLLYLIIEHRNIAGEAYPAMSNACFSP